MYDEDEVYRQTIEEQLEKTEQNGQLDRASEPVQEPEHMKLAKKNVYLMPMPNICMLFYIIFYVNLYIFVSQICLYQYYCMNLSNVNRIFTYSFRRYVLFPPQDLVV